MFFWPSPFWRRARWIPGNGSRVESLAQDFAQRAPKELPGWPATTIAGSGSSQNAAGRNAVLSFEVVNPWLSVLRGFAVEVTGTLKDANGKALWSKCLRYRSYDFGRSGKQEDCLKVDYAPLKQEIEFAAQQTATVRLQDLKQGL